MRSFPKQAPRSAYLHIPFCHRRCFYCDFVVEPLGDGAHGEEGRGNKSIKSYLEILKREIASVSRSLPLSTIYIGGGTPSLLSPLQIKSLLDHLKGHFGFQDGFELTLEVDPASFDKASLYGYLEAGVNRISLGGQSFDDSILLQLGRNHTRKDLIQACAWLNDALNQGDLSSWSLDLIQNLPGHNLLNWKSQLHQAIDSSAPHLSIYDLSIEPGTVFASKFEKGLLDIPKEDLASEISLMSSVILSNYGFSRYEISNYALPGHASRHNRVYWSGVGWWGFGQGATSCPWGERFSRPRTIDRYKKWVELQEKGEIQESLLQDNFKIIDFDEQLLVGLRRREGVDIEQLAITWGWNKKQREYYLSLLISAWEDSINSGLLIKCGMRFYLNNPQGMELSNRVLIEMFYWWENLPVDLGVQSILSEH